MEAIDPNDCQKKCQSLGICGNFTWIAGDAGASGKCNMYTKWQATHHMGDYGYNKLMVSGPSTCGDSRNLVASMKYGGPRPELMAIPEPDEPTIVEAKFATIGHGKDSDGRVFFFGYVAAGMGVAGLFVLAAYTLHRRAHREYNSMPEVLENGLSEATVSE